VSVAGVLLAAGEGSRFGGPKAVAELDGERLVDRAVRVLRLGGCDPVVVVLGAAVVEVPGADQVVVNPEWASGMGSSLRAGLAALPDTVDAAAVTLVDQPGLLPAAVRRVLAAGGDDPAAVLAVATYDGQRAHPVLLGRQHWAGVAELAVGDVGARPYLAARAGDVVEVGCDDAGDATDADTPEELAGRGILRRIGAGAGSAGGALGAGMAEFGAFYGGASARAAVEERQAEAFRRDEQGEGEPMDVDLDRGVVRIRPPSGPASAG
jgi:CTP:molybdopterin cytidylyltransferase MocA